MYDYVIVNDELPAARADLRCLYRTFRLQMLRQQDKIKKLLRGQK